MLKKLAAVVVVVALGLAGLVGYAATRPDHFEVKRSILVKAGPERVFPLIDDLGAFNTWNPFNADPAIKGSYSGPKSGKGAAYDFDGGSSGTGRIAIVDGSPPRRVDMRLTMVKPLAADNRIVFSLLPEPDGTRVTWSMSGKAGLLGRVIHLFVDMDTMVGSQFDKGLASLKALAEQKPPQ